MAQRTLVRWANLIDVPNRVDDATAAALGNWASGVVAAVFPRADCARRKRADLLGPPTSADLPLKQPGCSAPPAFASMQARLRVDVECLPLNEVEQAWARHRAAKRRRLVLMP
jgi:hypothetical protein